MQVGLCSGGGEYIRGIYVWDVNWVTLLEGRILGWKTFLRNFTLFCNLRFKTRQVTAKEDCLKHKRGQLTKLTQSKTLKI